MLTSVTVKDFKSYSSATLKLSYLTVLIGANASGKSNAIEALRMLAWIADGNKLSSIRYAAYEGKDAIRGGTQSLSRRGTDQFTLQADFNPPERAKYSVTLGNTADDELHIVGESLSVGTSSVPLFEVLSSRHEGSDLRVAYNNFARGGKKPHVTCTDQMAVLVQMQSAARFEVGHKNAQSQIPKTCKQAQDVLGQTVFLDPLPSQMRGYSFESETKLKSDGSNISGVLHKICAEKGGESAILDIIKSLPEQSNRSPPPLSTVA